MERAVDFLTGIQTPNLPTVADPVGPSDFVTLGYADANFTPLPSYGANMADITTLKAVAAIDRYDSQIRFIDGLDVFYNFDAASTATPDNDLIVQPDVGTGRWIKLVFGGGGGGSAAGIDTLSTRLHAEQVSRVQQEPLDSSIGLSGAFRPTHMALSARLYADSVATDTEIYTTFNPLYLNNSDKNFDTTTNWAVSLAGTTLTTSATKKIGTASVSFAKDASNVRAVNTYDAGSAILTVGSNSSYKCWKNLSSVTNFSKFVFKFDINGTDFAEFDVTTNAQGGAIVAGWNELALDLTVAPSATGGTGWDVSKPYRYYVEIIETTIAAQTLTILSDAVCFGLSEDFIGFVGQELTLYNNSTRETILIDSSNTQSHGKITLASALANNYAGGGSGAAVSNILRTTLGNDSDNQFIMLSDGLSGTILEKQELRTSKFFRETISGNFVAFFDLNTPQTYEITNVVSGTVIEIDDASDTTLNLVSGNSLHVFQRKFIDSEEYFIHKGDSALTAASTHSSGTTTVTASGGFYTPVAGDYVVKNHVVDNSISLVGAAANESYNALTGATVPNGVRLDSTSLPYINKDYIVAHWKLGSTTQADALKNQITGNSVTDLTTSGSLVFTNPFLRNRLSAGGFSVGSTADRLSHAANLLLAGAGQRTGFGFWIKPAAFTGTSRVVLTSYLTGGNQGGFIIALQAASNNITFDSYTANNNLNDSVSISFNPDKWNFVYCTWHESVSDGVFQVNGVRVVSANSGAFNVPVGLWFGNINSGPGAALGDGSYLADFMVWAGGPLLTTEQCSIIYGGGLFNPTGIPSNQLQYRQSINGMSGQKMSMKVGLEVETSAIVPSIGKMGAIKS